MSTQARHNAVRRARTLLKGSGKAQEERKLRVAALHEGREAAVQAGMSAKAQIREAE
jgi:hypothetical protein